ncbi:QueT transporter family protein [Secundilactobacillus oryzae]|nr:QueT transporter family protein [Secundilactobacillus oryzae]
MVLAPFSFAAVQVRLAEMFNLLAIFNKRYVIAVTLGVAISNFLMSPLGMIDVVWGSLSTLFTLVVLRFFIPYVKSFNSRLVTGVLWVTFSMFTIAAEIAFIGKTAFWATFWLNWGTIAIGEFISLVIGAILLYIMSKRIDLDKLLD